MFLLPETGSFEQASFAPAVLNRPSCKSTHCHPSEETLLRRTNLNPDFSERKWNARRQTKKGR